FEIPGTLGVIYNHATWLGQQGKDGAFPLLDADTFLQTTSLSTAVNFVHVMLRDLSPELLAKLRDTPNAVLIADTDNEHAMAEERRLFAELINNSCMSPVIIGRKYQSLTPGLLQLYAATDAGGLFIDGLGDGIFLRARDSGGHKMLNETAFNILQATRTRISKTEYISCPSCGRTLFDLQETTGKIRARTFHLKGIKIGIMGCIVNGPGEMADADYGYVGS